MPSLPPRLCTKHGIAVTGKCHLCEAEYKQRRVVANDKRISARKRGYTTTWDKLRGMKLSADSLCQNCQANGRVVPAVLVHHKDYNQFNNTWDNLMSVCRACHEQMHRGGQVPKPGVPVTIIAGPPGSGKSTYVDTRRQKGDVVIDLDIIKAKLAKLPVYHAGDEWLQKALWERDRQVARLSGKDKGKAWFIISAPKAVERREWKDKLSADEVVVMAVSPNTCISRINEDGRRPGNVKREHIQAVHRWWKNYVSDVGEKIVE